MTRGYSLEQDLRLLVNNPKYSDVEILCGDDKKLYGCKAILAARSEVFDGLFYNGMKESYEKQVSFPKINSSTMKMILEYSYTGSIRKESLTKDNLIEVFYASDYFQLQNFQDFIIETVKNTNYAVELLSKFVDFADTMPLSEDNILLNLLVEAVATMPLSTIEFGRLSIAGLRYLLSCTHEMEKSFETSEYEVFRYSAILAAKQISNNAFRTLMEQLPTLEQLGDSIQIVENKFIPDRYKIAKELEPLINFIDFSYIKGKILADIIEPLEIIPAEIFMDVYRQKSRLNSRDSNRTRGIHEFNESVCVWDESKCGSNLNIEDNGKVVYSVHSHSHGKQHARAKMLLDSTGIFEWDIIIEKGSDYFWAGVCAEEGGVWVWALRSNGSCCHREEIISYCPSFGEGAKITVHLNMNKRTLAFRVNGIKYPEVPGWNDLPSKLRPVVGLCFPGRVRIQPHSN